MEHYILFVCYLNCYFVLNIFFFHQTRLFKDLMHLTHSKYNIIIYAFGAIKIRSISTFCIFLRSKTDDIYL